VFLSFCDFFSSKHTLQNFREEIWAPRLMERRMWGQWEKDGKKDIEQQAREKAKEILASHKPQRLTPEVEAEGKPHLRRQELDEFIWWDINEPITIAVYADTSNVLKKVRERGEECFSKEGGRG